MTSEDPSSRTGRPLRGAPACALLLLAACRSYVPAPLDPAAHDAAWNARALELESADAFAARLESAGVPAERATDLDVRDGLSLEEGLLVARAYNADLRLARLVVARAAGGAEHAGAWRDPQLQFSGLRNSADVPGRWLLNGNLNLSLPLSGRAAAEERVAGAQLATAASALHRAEWDVERSVREAWLHWSATRRRAEETAALERTLDALSGSTEELTRSGELGSLVASRCRLELLTARWRAARLDAERDAARRALLALLGLAPDAPVELVPHALRPAGADTGPRTLEELARRNPRLLELRRAHEVAEARLLREIRAQLPDVVLGPAFEAENHQTKIGPYLGLTLPLWNANARAIAEAHAERELARARFETECERVAGEHAAALARTRSLARSSEALRDELVPLVDARTETAERLVRLGEGTQLDVLECLLGGHALKLELVEAFLAESLASLELDHLTGPPADANPLSDEDPR